MGSSSGHQRRFSIHMKIDTELKLQNTKKLHKNRTRTLGRIGQSLHKNADIQLHQIRLARQVCDREFLESALWSRAQTFCLDNPLEYSALIHGAGNRLINCLLNIYEPIVFEC